MAKQSFFLLATAALIIAGLAVSYTLVAKADSKIPAATVSTK
ncbi:MAG: hypothetical protein Q8L24_00555 [bacterium]|nr:hypothetical protein [bacterium]